MKHPWFGAAVAVALLLGVPAAADQITGGRPAEYTVSVKTLGARGDTQSFGAASAQGTSPGVPGDAATMTAGSAVLTATASTTFAAGDIGKAVTVDGAGVSAGPLSTTIAGFTDAQHVTLAATASTATPAFQLANCIVTTDQAGAGSYAPTDTVTMTGGSGTQAVCKVQATQVHAATVNAAGSGGTTGACILTGTTGTSASGLGFFQVNATITAGAVSAIGSFVTQGIYTTNPTLISAEPVTSNCGATGVTLTLVMGIKYAYPTNAGLYAPLPTFPIAQGSTSGSGTGATFSPFTNTTGNFYYGTDDSAAFAAAVAKVNALATAGTPAVIEVPTGNYLLRSTPIPIFAGPGGIVGEGQLKSVLLLDAQYAGDLFSWTETCFCTTPYNGTTTVLSPNRMGPQVSGIGVIGDRSAAGQQDAFKFYDRNDYVRMQDVSVFHLPGVAIGSGILKNKTQGWMRESMFSHIRIENAGLPGVAAVEFNNVGGGGTHDMQLHDVNIYGSAGTGMWIHSDASSSTSIWEINSLRIEGLEYDAANNSGDLLELGDNSGSGNLNAIQIKGAELVDPYLGGAALHVLQPSGQGATYNIVFEGSVLGSAGYGKGLWLQGGRNSIYSLGVIGTNDYNVQIDSSTLVGAANQIINTSRIAFTTNVDATSTQNQAVWLVPPAATGAIRASTAGNARGNNAVDLQSCAANTAVQVASALQSTIGGGCNNTAGSNNSVVGGGQSNTTSGGVGNTISGGQSNALSGTTSFIGGGQHSTDRGAYTANCWASGDFAANGDSQGCDYLLRGTTSNTSAVTLTGDGAAAGSANCVDVPTLTGYLLSVDVYAFDHTTPGNNESWQGYVAKIHRPSTAASTVVVLGTKPTALTSGTVTGSDISITADTTNGCLNISFTPPSANTDAWRAVAKVRTIQVQ